MMVWHIEKFQLRQFMNISTLEWAVIKELHLWLVVLDRKQSRNWSMVYGTNCPNIHILSLSQYMSHNNESLFNEIIFKNSLVCSCLYGGNCYSIWWNSRRWQIPSTRNRHCYRIPWWNMASIRSFATVSSFAWCNQFRNNQHCIRWQQFTTDRSVGQ